MSDVLANDDPVVCVHDLSSFGGAVILGIPPTTLYSKMRKHRIHPARFKTTS